MISPIIATHDADLVSLRVDILIAQMAYDYRVSQGAIASVISGHLSTTRIPSVSGAETAKTAGLVTTPNSPPSQPAFSLASAADASTIPPVDEATDGPARPSLPSEPSVAQLASDIISRFPNISAALHESEKSDAEIPPSPLPGDPADGAGIPSNRAPTPSAAFSPAPPPTEIEAALRPRYQGPPRSSGDCPMTKQTEIADEVAAMRAKGASWLAIGAALGVSPDTARFSVDREYAERRKQANNARRRTERGYVPSKIHRVDPGQPSPDDAKRALAAIPADTRDFTARAFGDPLPGRSALDKRMGGV